MAGKAYFITGANRGIGLALAQALAADPTNTVVASARDPTTATELNALVAKGNVKAVKLDVSSQDSIDQLDAQLATVAADGIDYFISNAGANIYTPDMTTDKIGRAEWLSLLTTNAIGPVMITNVVKPYLLKKDTRVIYFVSSITASIGGFVEYPSSAYGMSKAALNHYAKLLSWELKPEGFIVVAAHPGSVLTDMLTKTVQFLDETIIAAVKTTGITPEQSAQDQLKLIHKLTKEDSGKFYLNSGEVYPW